MRRCFVTLSVLGWSLIGLPACAQKQPGNNGAPSNSTANQQSAAPPADQQNNQNPFPEDTSDVPVIPTHDIPGLAPEEGRMAMPAGDADPVHSPEDAEADAESQEQSSSSSLAGMRDLLPPADDDATQPKKHGGKGDQADDSEPPETAAEDESVGNYYLDNKDWKAALSRFQSALVLDPYNPDVYWSLAEAERGLGQFAEARANYEKVVEYDPGSHHAKEAKKALDDPQIANAKASRAALPAAQ
jgi:tetratricopeptide (TPR) repeat protein